MSVSKTRPAPSADASGDDAHKPRPLTLAENIVLSLKVLAGAVALGAALWAINVWVAAK